MTFPTSVNIIEVAARDGLQDEQQIVPTVTKLEFIKMRLPLQV